MEYEESYRGQRIVVTTTRHAAGVWKAKPALPDSQPGAIALEESQEDAFPSEEEAKRAALSAAAGAIDRAPRFKRQALSQKDHSRVMTDVHTAEQRSYNMSRIQGRNTKPELRVRRILHAAGLRYRLHGKGLPGKPDLVFAGMKAVVFVHGCFWHMHGCRYGKPAPATNTDFWAQKRRSNVDRDKRNLEALTTEGWRVFEIWECETRDEEALQLKLEPVIAYWRATGNRLVGRPA